MTRILDGSSIASTLEHSVASRVSACRARGVHPTLVILLFGDDAPSRVYGGMIRRGAERVGIDVRVLVNTGSVSFAEASTIVRELNSNSDVHGILIKRPLPGALADEAVLQRIDPAKDVDGCHFENVGRLVIGGAKRAPVPCTPAGVLALLERSSLSTEGQHVVVLGRSTTVGRPLANLLAQKESGANATVTLCHTATRELERHTRAADILVSAIGRPRFVTRSMVAPHAVVVDVGTNVVPDAAAPKGYRLVGDCDYDALVGHCAAITPVPGGVGPVTVAMLLSNVVDAAERVSGTSA
ncbi:MAG: bifunctional 5,10-methylenetetrahydrofolate dehydrogenase/5,10-methenyltetrahydrofolate cyclohydrolase [Planctomycetes bacterium]|nr:bifunctional 5,10-methylenetetrahydrofolate dehydrogenase/5,10-methenyltetrahydrofolate cyclohydrolase [Planctomycetota bacterium]MCC7173483.1 bifunctional 5,10-methylenetetrahydrofolate dehydrogenase/5,10-methenyltetrahydrofolate cyclohydrolase [Planctomycetota bacterium]